MIKLILTSFLLLILIGCSDFNNPIGMTYSSFVDSPVEDLAESMESGDIDEFKKQIKLDYKSINYIEPQFRKTLLHMAVYYQLDQFVLELLKFGATTEIEMIGEETPLILASSKNSLLIVKHLIQFGVDVNHSTITKADNLILSPLLEACQSNEPNSFKIAKTLIDNKADVDFGNDVRFPMQEALIFRNMDIVKYLIFKGADHERVFLNEKEYNPKSGKIWYFKDYMEYCINNANSKKSRRIQKEILSYINAHQEEDSLK